MIKKYFTLYLPALFSIHSVNHEKPRGQIVAKE